MNLEKTLSYMRWLVLSVPRRVRYLDALKRKAEEGRGASVYDDHLGVIMWAMLDDSDQVRTMAERVVGDIIERDVKKLKPFVVTMIQGLPEEHGYTFRIALGKIADKDVSMLAGDVPLIATGLSEGPLRVTDLFKERPNRTESLYVLGSIAVAKPELVDPYKKQIEWIKRASNEGSVQHACGEVLFALQRPCADLCRTGTDGMPLHLS